MQVTSKATERHCMNCLEMILIPLRKKKSFGSSVVTFCLIARSFLNPEMSDRSDFFVLYEQ